MAAHDTIWTIGYEAAGFGAFLDVLRRAGVRQVIDVRDLPLSRRAGFSKRVLAASLAEAGLAYAHLRHLGTPKEGRVAAHKGDYATFWSVFERRLTSVESQMELRQAADLAHQQPSALLCFEADPARCHRRRVAELLRDQFGFAVVDLMVDPLMAGAPSSAGTRARRPRSRGA
ncbi:MAG: DUF488 family protein [Actinomycetota bacterium]